MCRKQEIRPSAESSSAGGKGFFDYPLRDRKGPATLNLLTFSLFGRAPLRQEGSPQQILTEEAALARALELSLMDVQQQEHRHVPGGGRQAAAAASTALQDTIPQDMQNMAPE